MVITVNIALDKGEPAAWTMSLDEVADAVLKAVGGDETKDRCVVTMRVQDPGHAGVPQTPPEPFYVQQNQPQE